MRISLKISILFLFFASGVSGLIYEVVWIRIFGLVLGNTTYAISAVLAAFFAGLGLGGFCAGRFVDKLGAGDDNSHDAGLFQDESRLIHAQGVRDTKTFSKRINTIRIYGFLELGIAISALLICLGITDIKTAFIWLHQLIGHHSPAGFTIARFTLSFLIMLIPTTFMGATLPVLSKSIIRQYKNVGDEISSLYGINTFGAACGCFLTGFYLIETTGLNTTIYIAVTINCIVGIIALVLDMAGFFKAVNQSGAVRIDNSQRGDVSSWPQGTISRKKGDSGLSRHIILIASFAIGLSGLASIAYEIIWTRMLSLVFLNSIYSFTTMLTTFLVGLGVGAYIARRFINGRREALLLLGIIESCIGIAAILLIWLFDWLPEVSSGLVSFLTANGIDNLTWGKNVIIEFAVAFMVIIGPVILIGMTLPIVSQIVSTDIRLLGHSIGNIYSINLFGAIVGAFIAGCLLIPWIGIKASELSIGGLNICIGIAILVFTNNTKKLVLIPCSCVFAIIMGIFASFQDIRILGTDVELLYYNEDSTATVSVIQEKDGNKKLIVNNKYTLGTSKAAPLQQRMGYIPLLIHDNPKDILVIGMGTGITLSATALYYKTEAIDCVEVIPSVAEASQRHFSIENNMVFKDKKIHIIIDDGRNYIMLNKKRYDVIISDLFVPYHAGAGSLYSLEHFQVCRDRILDNGLFCQWLPLYQMSVEEFRVICKTFINAFPHATLWFCNFEKGLICGLVGTKERLKVDPFILREKIAEPSMKYRFKETVIGSPEEFLSLFITDEKGLKSFTEDCVINSDNRPVIEFAAPKNLYKDTQPGLNNLLIISGMRGGALPLLMISQYPSSPPFLNNGAQPPGQINEGAGVSGDEGYTKKGGFDIQKIRYYEEATGHLISGLLYYYKGMLNEALDEYLTAWELAPDYLYVRKMYQDLSVTFYRNDRYDETIFINERLVNTHTDIIDPYSYFYLGLAYQAKGEIKKAIDSYHNSLALNPTNPASIHYNLGVIYKGQGELEKAIKELEEVIRLEPHGILAYEALATMYLEMGVDEKAEKLLEEAGRINSEIVGSRQ